MTSFLTTDGNRFGFPARRPIEFLFLLGLIIALPLLEAPKNIFWLGFVVAWTINRWQERNTGGPWDHWDGLIAAWIASGYIIALFAGLHHGEWGGANDILRYGLVLWLIKRSGYEKMELKWLLGATLFSSFTALTFALGSLYFTSSIKALQLNSVGHVNHSAIYLAISYGATLAAVLAFWKSLSTGQKLIGISLALLFAGSVLLSASRGAIGIALINTLALGVAWLRRSAKPLTLLATAAILAVGGAYLAQVEVVKKQEARFHENNLLAYRPLIWNTALAAWNRFPLFGVGMDNFKQIDAEKIRSWREEAGKPFNPADFQGSSHSHNLYLNTLAERGLFGLAIVAAALLSWIVHLLRHLPEGRDEDTAWALWGACFSAWLVTAGAGFVNTTLHHEHGILSMLLLGMWLAYRRRTGTSAPLAKGLPKT